jgi:hypothetical protein
MRRRPLLLCMTIIMIANIDINKELKSGLYFFILIIDVVDVQKDGSWIEVG